MTAQEPGARPAREVGRLADRATEEARRRLAPDLAREGASGTTPPNDPPRLPLLRRQTSDLPTEVLPTVIPNPTETSIDLEDDTLAVDSTILTSTSLPTLTATATATPSASESAATAESSSENGDEGMSTVAKAGIAIGVLGGVLVVFVFVYLIFSLRKRKLEKQRQHMEDDEKIHGPFADSAAIRPPPPAPRLSLRPVTQFLPTFNSQSQVEKQASRGIALTLNPVPAPSPTTSLSPLNRPTQGSSAWERPTLDSTRNSPTPNGERPDTRGSLHPSNPFNDTQRIPDEPVSPVSSLSTFDFGVGVATTTDAIPEPVSPIDGDDDDDHHHHHHHHNHHNHEIGVASSGGADAAATTSSLTRKTSIRKDLPKPLDLTKSASSPLTTVPPSPTGTEYSMRSVAPGQPPAPSAGAAAIAAAGGPAHSTVHRVQLDFKPTLDDEMELRAGQLVRLLHEYDDGWALCIRLDRSEQGVVPRTCLSARPVKPRPPQGAAGSGNSRSYQQQQQQSTLTDRPHSPGDFPPVPYGSNAGYPAPSGLGQQQDLDPPPGQAY